jgi:DNA-binding CsgD family transcriptional regulator
MRSRIIYLSSVRNDPAAVDFLRQVQGYGGEVRTAPTLPLRMVVVDRRTAIVPLSSDDAGGTTLRVSGTSLTTALLALFNGLWREAAPLGAVRRRTVAGLSSQDKAVLRLLGAGHTDEAVARQLGISVRSTRRIVAGLLVRLNARSRFQAGLLAASRAWVELDDLD